MNDESAHRIQPMIIKDLRRISAIARRELFDDN